MRASVVALGVAMWASPSSAFSVSTPHSVASKSFLPLASSCSPPASSLSYGTSRRTSAGVGPSMGMERRDALLAGGFLGAALASGAPAPALAADEGYSEVIPGSDGKVHLRRCSPM